VRFFRSTDPQKIMSHLALSNPDFVVLDGFPASQTSLLPAVTAYPSRFELVYTTQAAPRTYILRVRAGDEAGGTGSRGARGRAGSAAALRGDRVDERQ